MAKSILIIPASDKVEATRTSLALAKAFNDNGIKATMFEPIDQKDSPSKTANNFSISRRHTEHLLSHGWLNELLEEVVALHEKISHQQEIVIIRGLTNFPSQPYAGEINAAIADTFNAKIIILAAADKKERSTLESQINIVARFLGGAKNNRILGYIINRLDVPGDFINTEISFITNIPHKKCPKFRRQAIIKFIAKRFDREWLLEAAHGQPPPYVSPSIFRHRLIQLAKGAKKRIALPESEDIRILKAAIICSRRKIAKCVLFGDPQEIEQVAEKNGLSIKGADIEIINPELNFEKHVPRLVSLRKHKGMTTEVAFENLKDPMMLATMMLENNEIDGIVSGAMHTTANTVRPALQIIKTSPGMSLVSSIFFMCLPEQVLIFGDCAINPNPDAKELAEIAIQSADSSRLFGIEPKVAMISYSTGSSGSGIDVEKVREATKIVQTRRPDILIDGPLQYDAAIIEDVARQKAPDSKVAGNATVLIFPDLNTGNALYKAVQRSANILSIGPMLQGLRKPVNDLSRGCLVEDIVFTISLTAIQATHNPTL